MQIETFRYISNDKRMENRIWTLPIGVYVNTYKVLNAITIFARIAATQWRLEESMLSQAHAEKKG